MILNMFLTFFKIGAFTFGGGYVMISIIMEEVVEKKNWLSNEEFMDALAIAQASPGSMAANISIFVGYKLKGARGAIACLLGAVLPAFLTILLVATFFYKVRDNVILERMFLGIRPAVVGLILSAVYRLMKSARFGYAQILVSIATVFVVVFLKVSPLWAILAGTVGSVVINKIKRNHELNKQ